MIIAIDGPAGSGKSTIAKLLAKRLGYQYIDTGAMYRAVTLLALEAKLGKPNLLESREILNASSDSALLADILPLAQIRLVGEQVFVASREVSHEIRSLLVSANVAVVAAMEKVREYLVKLQQGLGKSSNCVMDGRDIGTVVFPDAQLKIFLTASPEVRAKRRLKEYELRGETVDYAALVDSIKYRDKLDSERAISPLKKASDAIEINNDNYGIDEVLEMIHARVHALS